MARKQTPDILGQATAAPAPASQKASKPARPKATKKAAPAPAADKLKATFYLEPVAADALELSWMKLRSLAGDKRGRISKSGLVEQALLELAEQINSETKAKRLLATLLERQD